MNKDEIDKIVKEQINKGLIHPNDGAKKEGFEMGLLYAINQGQSSPIDSVSNRRELLIDAFRFVTNTE